MYRSREESRPRNDRKERDDRREGDDHKHQDGHECREREIDHPTIARVKISAEHLCEELPRIFDNRVVAAFEGDYTPSQTHIWINEFNNSSDIQLLYTDTLVNSLFVVEVIEVFGDSGRERLRILLESWRSLRVLQFLSFYIRSRGPCGL